MCHVPCALRSPPLPPMHPTQPHVTSRHITTEDNIVPPTGYPNPYTEIVIRTQCPLSMHPMTGTELSSRNHINILSSDIVIALPGSSGTWSEIQLAIRYVSLRKRAAARRAKRPKREVPAAPRIPPKHA